MASSPVTPASLEGGTPSPNGSDEPANNRQVRPIISCRKNEHTELHFKTCEFKTNSIDSAHNHM